MQLFVDTFDIISLDQGKSIGIIPTFCHSHCISKPHWYFYITVLQSVPAVCTSNLEQSHGMYGLPLIIFFLDINKSNICFKCTVQHSPVCLCVLSLTFKCLKYSLQYWLALNFTQNNFTLVFHNCIHSAADYLFSSLSPCLKHFF